MFSLGSHIRGGGSLLIPSETAYGLTESSTAYYDTHIKVSDLGHYDFEVEAHEIPSNEILPIIDKSYFPITVSHFQSEIDNTAPSAIYKSKPVSKVDVVFAFGETDKSDAMQKYIPSFESRLQSAGNFIDAHVEKVETITGGFSMEDADAGTIYNFWDQCPNPNNYILSGDFIVNAIFSWNGFSNRWRTDTPFNHFFIESGTWDVDDFELSSVYAWHGCGVPSGYVFHYDKKLDECYILLVGNSVELYRVWDVESWLGQSTGETGGSTSYNEVYLGHNNNFNLSNVKKLAGTRVSYPSSGKGEYLKLKVEGNTITVYDANNELLRYVDPNPIERGGVGLFAGCTVSFSEVTLAYDKTIRKSLGEAISDVSWRDNSTRFVVYAEDTIPEYMKTTDNKDYQYTITKLLNSNAYLVNLGTSLNQATLEQLVEFISTPTEQKGTFILNNSTTQSMNKACDWIIEKVRNLSKPEDWILVNTEVIWETEYNDQEHDLPLNFGEHDGTKNSDNSDILLGKSWGVGLTHLYKNEKIFAEKWRYRHFNNYFDNSTIRESYHNTWIEDPVTIFPNPGLYRVNYKRRDNPLYPDVNLTHNFDSYRYWSENYDRIEQYIVYIDHFMIHN